MRSLRLPLLSLILVVGLTAFAQDAAPSNSESESSAPATVVQLPSAPQPAPGSFDQVLDRVVEREHFFVAQMRHSHPLVETYIQNMKSDKEMGAIPTNDHYFLGRLDISQGEDDRLFVGQPGFSKRMIQRGSLRHMTC